MGCRQYNPMSSSPDIHLRMFTVCSLFLFVFGSSTLMANKIIDGVTVFSDTYSSTHDIYIYAENLHLTTNCLHRQTSWTQPLHARFLQQKLFLSSDVETNPGPRMDEADKNDIMEAITKNCDSLKLEIQNVRSDTAQIKSDVESVKSICAEVKVRVDKLEDKTRVLAATTQEIESEVRALSDERDVVGTDINALQEICETQRDSIDQLVIAVEKLERDKIKSSMRIFGLPELALETEDSLKSEISNSVLNVACPTHLWETDTVTEAFRVGKPSGNGHRLVIAKFKSASDKHRLYKGRDKLRENGIRISEDLTTRERDILHNLRQNGRVGYFQKGKLHIRPDTSDQNRGRLIVNARRRTHHAMDTDGVRNTEGPEHADID